MKQKDIIEKLKSNCYIEHKRIGYQTDNIFIYEEGNSNYLDKLSKTQLDSLLKKNLLQIESRNVSTLNGIGDRIMDIIKIKYISPSS